jgi:hypothetical protein
MYYSIEKRISARTVYLIVFYISAIMMTAITFYALYQSIIEFAATGKIVIGEILVRTEFPFKGFSKLVTYLMIVSVVSWYCVTKLGGDKVKEVSPALRSIFQLIVLAIVVISLYEFVYNFVVWSSLITINALGGSINLDRLSIAYPNPQTPWNLVFATKMSLAAFLISSHGFYIISKKGKT